MQNVKVIIKVKIILQSQFRKQERQHVVRAVQRAVPIYMELASWASVMCPPSILCVVIVSAPHEEAQESLTFGLTEGMAEKRVASSHHPPKRSRTSNGEKDEWLKSHATVASLLLER